MNEKLKRATQDLDAYYDSLLENCTTIEQAMQVEESRRKAHAEIAKHVMQNLTSGFARPGNV